MSSRAIAVLMLLLPLMMTNSTATPSPIEHCLRMRLYPPSPPPAGSELFKIYDFSRSLCQDVFRGVRHSLRITGELPLDYIIALCDIFGDNEDKVESYVKHILGTNDFLKLSGGRTCATIRMRQRANPDRSSLW
ncbi:unnamed protein product [Sphenostylis stenocarpa]|uniref:Uncharacterized protein n=1 Tax=Sphenostylis stenocarpa TaxID=92480 RepID=A0AA86TAD0_9FABA|nr:unnamed protein product [Sphenostylis stenocarpa]